MAKLVRKPFKVRRGKGPSASRPGGRAKPERRGVNPVLPGTKDRGGKGEIRVTKKRRRRKA